MATGDTTLINKFKENLGLSKFNMETDTFKCMISKASATDPDQDDSDPGYAAARTQDWSDAGFEVTAGGAYTGGGDSLGSVTWTLSQVTDTVTWDAGVASITWSQNGSSPTDARWFCIYDDTSSGKEGVCFIDLGQTFDMTSGDLTLTFSTSPNAIFTLA